MIRLGEILKTRSPITILLLISGVVVLGWFIHSTLVIWGYIIISIAIAYLLAGPVNKLSDRGIPRTISILIVFSIIAGLIVFSLVMLIPTLVDQINKFADEFPKYADQAQSHFKMFDEWLAKSTLPDEIKEMPDRLLNGVQEYSVNFLQMGIAWVLGLFKQIYAIIIIPLSVFYILKDVHVFRILFISLFSDDKKDGVRNILERMDTAFGGFIRSRLKLCLVVGVGMVVLLSILKVPYPFILGLIAGICEFIPYIGPIVGAIPTLIIGIMSEKFIVALIIVLTVQILENVVFVPKIMGSEMGLHPLVVIIALLAGSKIAGVGGMVLSVPFVAAVKILSEYAAEQLKLHQRFLEAKEAEEVAAAERAASAAAEEDAALKEAGKTQEDSG
ncbi:MAG TPA: AI-2E family transporter [bacterium]|nr:AI-2E family transporter [bacterium]